MKKLLLWVFLFILFFSYALALNPEDYKETMEWDGQVLDLYPITMDFNKTSNDIIFKIDKTTKDGYTFKYPKANSIEIWKDGSSVWKITTGATPYQVSDIKETKEWAYPLVSGYGTDVIEGKSNLIQKGEYVCIENSYFENGFGLAKKSGYTDCLYYPQVWNNVTNTTEVNITIDKNKATINYPLPYDPLTTNYTQGLVSCWDFENDGSDYLGNYNLQENGGITYTTGIIGNASQFTQTSGDFFNSTDFATAIQGDSAFTMCSWIQSDDINTDNGWMAGYNPSGADDGFSMRFDADSSGTIRQTITLDPGALIDIESSSGIQTTGWLFVCTTWNKNDASGINEMYVNGTKEILTVSDSESVANGIGTNVNNFNIGRGVKNAASSWDGLIDTITYWNRKLNTTEISELYNSGNGVSCADIVASGSGGANCTESIVNVTINTFNSSCSSTDFLNSTWNWTYYDQNECGLTANQTGSFINQTYACDYCVPNATNTSLTFNATLGCLINDTQNDSYYQVQYDSNTCFAITGLEADNFTNTTFNFYFYNVTCDFCTPNGVNSTPINTLNSSCGSDNFINSTWNWTSSDGNSCYATTGLASDVFNSQNYSVVNQTYACVYGGDNVSTITFETRRAFYNDTVTGVSYYVINGSINGWQNISSYDDSTGNTPTYTWNNVANAFDGNNATSATETQNLGSYNPMSLGKNISYEFVSEIYVNATINADADSLGADSDLSIYYVNRTGTAIRIINTSCDTSGTTNCNLNIDGFYTINDVATRVYALFTPQAVNYDSFQVTLTELSFQTGINVTSDNINLTPDNYTVIAIKDGYYDQNKSFTVLEATDATVTVYPFYNTLLTLNLIDSQDTSIISGASTITINDTTYNSTNGTFILPFIAGNYTVTASNANYATETVNITVTNITSNNNITMSTTNTLIITFKDSDTLSVINNVSIEYWAVDDSGSNSTTNGTVYLTFLQPRDYTLRYNSTGYNTNLYFITIINNTYQSITLYLNPDTISNVTVEIIDTSAAVVEGAIVNAMLFVPATNTYVTTASGITNTEGETLLGIYKNTEFYKFQVIYNGEVVKLTDPFIVSKDTLRIQVDLEDEDYLADWNEFRNINSEVVFNTATNNFRFQYVAGTNYYFCLKTYSKGVLSDTMINTTCETGSTGTILHAVSNSSGATYYSQGFVTINDQEYFLGSDSYTFPLINLGNKGLFYQILLTVAMSLSGFLGVELLLIAGPLSLIIGGFIGLHSLGLGYTLPILIIGILIAMGLKKNNG